MPLQFVRKLYETSSRQKHQPKQLKNVTIRDIIRAVINATELRNLFVNQWNQMEWGFDEHDEPMDAPYPIPTTFNQLTREQIKVMVDWYEHERPDILTRTRNELEHYAAMPVIPVSRKLKSVSDLTKPLGRHWAAVDEKIIQHKNDVMIYGIVENKYVDWTLCMARGQFWWDQHHEIAVIADAPVNLLRMTFPEGTTAVA